MVIYMAQMTPTTGRMVGSLSGNPIPFLIPIFLTIILLSRHPVSFHHKKLWTFAGIMFCWTIAVCYKWHDFSSGNLSYYFFLFYAIFIAYIHIRVYGRDLFHIYEHIMVVFSLISLLLWGMSIIFPNTISFFQLFPTTPNNGYNILYLFHWTNSTRNSGCSWEPGRFAIMLILAIIVNLSRKGVTFHKNKKGIILLAALASTMSTTGYSIAILLYFIYWLEKINIKRILIFFVIILPISAYLFSLDFMAEKIEERARYEEIHEERLGQFEYYNEETNGEEYVASLDRFESASFEWLNFQNDPLLGYGRNNKHSWFRQEITENFELTGGLVKVFSQYGVFVGSLLYLILFLSSVKISREFPHKRSYAFVLTLMLCSVSYVVFTIPIFTALWFYGLFGCEEDLKRKSLMKFSNRYNRRVFGNDY